MRYARLGGGQESKNAICILNMNMINDKVTLYQVISNYDRDFTSGLHHSLVLALHPSDIWGGPDLHPGVPGLILHDQILPHEGDKLVNYG